MERGADRVGGRVSLDSSHSRRFAGILDVLQYFKNVLLSDSVSVLRPKLR